MGQTFIKEKFMSRDIHSTYYIVKNGNQNLMILK